MMTLLLNVNPIEREILSIIGKVSILDDSKADEVKIEFSLAHYSSFALTIEWLNEIIERQESDQGDWQRWQQYTAAKPGLLTKLRIAIMKPVSLDGDK